MSNQNKLERDLSEVAVKVKQLRSIILTFHDDADGVCSAAIVKAGLATLGAEIRLVCLEKLYPEAVEMVQKQGLPTMYVDIASPHEELVTRYSANFSLILDHHQAERARTNVININPWFYGFKGDSECSASTLCFLFARNFDLDQKKIAELAVIGTTGDLQKEVGLNKIPFSLVKVKGASAFAGKLTILASAGYYMGGPKKAVDAALTGFTKELSEELKRLEERRKLKFRELEKKLQVKQSKEFSWFHSGSHLSEFGVKVIGSFCSYLSFQPYRFGIKKPLLGFMNLSNELPGLGKLKREYVKVSARLPKGIKSKINLGLLLQKACAEFNGLGEGHSVAASGVILKGKEEDFVSRLDELAST